MKIETTVEYYCDSGFYCKRNGVKKCGKLRDEGYKPYCEIYLPFLEKDPYGNVLKCKDCLLAERKQRLKSDR